MIDKTFDFKSSESKFYNAWEKSGAFKSQNDGKKQPFTLMMPPANVTGNLHMGHALTFTLQDVLVRYQRMMGKDVLWQPGVDHAGIATQMVVERNLAEKGLNRRDMGREKFLEETWKWKEHSGGSIINQLKRLGASADWDRERFTMDDPFNKAVTKVFVDLHKKGLIYRDKRLVNWDIKFQTAISDIEVEQKEIKSSFWHLRYPIENSDDYIVIATTRPETFFADVAVAVSDEDDRYKHLIGKHIVLPITNRKIPIIMDEHADPEKGTGAVKITPAHDFNDFEVGKRHNLDLICVVDQFGKLNENAPQEYQGLTVEDARKKVVTWFEENNLLEKTEKIKNMVPHGDRSGVIIDPFLMDQWYVDTKKLAGPAIEAVEKGDTKFFPDRWKNFYFEWMRNIQPWCISRQLWWGHQIPVWYGPDGKFFVEETEQDAHSAATKHYGKTVELARDEDVLDTWFSSGLWPFVTLDWPNENGLHNQRYPGDVLITGFDIIFFWVARMMMMGLHFKKDVPFKHTYIHSLVLDEKGKKMSKSKGNVIDPLILIDQYGADAVRFCLTSMASPGRDIRLSEKLVEQARNFGTKIWNATRYLQMNGAMYDPDFDPQNCTLQINQWIIGELQNAMKTIDTSFIDYKFNDGAMALYHFTWNTFCDWYIEFTKPILQGSDGKAKTETQKTLAWVLAKIYHLMHPYMPFVSEELWAALGGKGLLIEATWPSIDYKINSKTSEPINWMIDAITKIRGLKSEMQIPASKKLSIEVYGLNTELNDFVAQSENLFKTLARLESVVIKDGDATIENAAQLMVEKATIVIPLEGLIDIDAEKSRLEKEIQRLEKELISLGKRLGNPQFKEKAPAEIIDELTERQTTFNQEMGKNKAALAQLS